MSQSVRDSSDIFKTGQAINPPVQCHFDPPQLSVPVRTIALACLHSGWGWEDIARNLKGRGLAFDPVALREFVVKGSRP